MISDLIGIVGKFIPDHDKAKELEAKIQEAHNKALTAAVESDKEIQLAEMKSGGLRSAWRPMAAIMVFMCLFLYWFVYPLSLMIIGWFDLPIYMPELPELPLEFYGLATAFISIYAYGRSLEKRSR